MTLRLNPANLSRLEKLFHEAGYILRYEKGTFNSGYCILEDRKVIVVNKFLDLEGRINTLLDILPQLDIAPDLLTLDCQKLFFQVTAETLQAPGHGKASDGTQEEPTSVTL